MSNFDSQSLNFLEDFGALPDLATLDDISRMVNLEQDYSSLSEPSTATSMMSIVQETTPAMDLLSQFQVKTECYNSTSTASAPFSSASISVPVSEGSPSESKTRKRSISNADIEELRDADERRHQQCRISAKLCRERKKQFIANLQEQVVDLTYKKTELESMVNVLMHENQRLRETRLMAIQNAIKSQNSSSEILTAPLL